MNITPKPLTPPDAVTDAELRHEDELAWVGVASCCTCGICRAVAELRLARHATVRDARRTMSGPELEQLAGAARQEC